MNFDRTVKFPQLHPDRLELWVWYADKVPPHIGCSISGVYFSLKSGGKDDGLPVQKVAELVCKKQIPFLLISVNISFDALDVSTAYSTYDRASENGATCLTPILDLLEVPNQITQLSHLLDYLEETDGIKHIFGFNLPSGFIGISEYGEKEIRERLRKLEDVKRKERIPAFR